MGGGQVFSTGRNSAPLQGVFEDEWMYRYMVCSPIDLVPGNRLGGSWL